MKFLKKFFKVIFLPQNDQLSLGIDRLLRVSDSSDKGLNCSIGVGADVFLQPC